MDIKTLQQKIGELTEKHDFAGIISISNNGEEQLTLCRGNLTPQGGTPVTKDTRYALSSATRFFTLVSALKLAEEGKLNINAKVIEFFPTLTHIAEATVKNLIRLSSGIEDYSTTVLGMQVYNRKKELNLSEGEFIALRNKLRNRIVTVQEVVEMVQDLPPLCKCGMVSESTTEYLLLGAILEKVSGCTLAQLFDSYVIKPLNLTQTTFDAKLAHQGYIRYENSEEVFCAGTNDNVDGNNGIVTTATDAIKLLEAIRNRRLLKAKTWKWVFAKYDDWAYNVFSKSQSWYYLRGDCCGNSAVLYASSSTNTVMAVLSNRHTKYLKNSSGDQLYFLDQLSNVVQGYYLKPTKLILAPLSCENGFEAQAITIEESQRNFVNTPKDAMSMLPIFGRTHKCYVLTDCGVIVGLAVIEANKKKEDYWINIFMIDKLHQGKGYGKMAIALLRDKLVEMGANKVQIAFNQRNERARHVYESCGFKCVEAWDWAIRMVYEHNPTN